MIMDAIKYVVDTVVVFYMLISWMTGLSPFFAVVLFGLVPAAFLASYAYVIKKLVDSNKRGK